MPRAPAGRPGRVGAGWAPGGWSGCPRPCSRGLGSARTRGREQGLHPRPPETQRGTPTPLEAAGLCRPGVADPGVSPCGHHVTDSKDCNREGLIQASRKDLLCTHPGRLCQPLAMPLGWEGHLLLRRTATHHPSHSLNWTEVPGVIFQGQLQQHLNPAGERAPDNQGAPYPSAEPPGRGCPQHPCEGGQAEGLRTL